MENQTPDWLLPDKAYDVLKWAGLIVCPALATLILAIGGAIDWADAQAAAVIVTAVGTFIGATIGVSAVRGGEADEE